MQQRLGIFGGTFDPIHIGHLIIASEVCSALELDVVHFVVAPRPPHKKTVIASDDDRVRMVKLAIANDKRFTIDLREFTRGGQSYTVDTLRSYRQQYEDAELFFLMGEDSLRDLPHWRSPHEILALASIAVASRPDVDVDLTDIHTMLPSSKGRIVTVATPEVAISSTMIRKRCRDGETIKYLVPNEINDYIALHRPY